MFKFCLFYKLLHCFSFFEKHNIFTWGSQHTIYIFTWDYNNVIMVTGWSTIAATLFLKGFFKSTSPWVEINLILGEKWSNFYKRSCFMTEIEVDFCWKCMVRYVHMICIGVINRTFHFCLWKKWCSLYGQ